MGPLSPLPKGAVLGFGSSWVDSLVPQGMQDPWKAAAGNVARSGPH